MAKTITTRLPDEFIEGLNKIAEIEKLDMSAALRRLLSKSIVEWKKEYAVEQYKKGEFSFGQAAKFAEVSVWDFPSLLKQSKTALNYDIEELEAELKTIRWKKK